MNGPGLCAECHNPRNFLGGIVAVRRFTGRFSPSGGEGKVPSMTHANLDI